MNRLEIFSRDGFRCVYCGERHDIDLLSVDHVQPRVRGGDNSGGNVVTACMACNTAKGSSSLARFLGDNPAARVHFFAHARHVWPRHLRTLRDDLARR